MLKVWSDHMPITRYSKRKNINERESINTKLKVTDYVFNYNNEDFNNATLEYYFDKIKNVEMSYEDEKKIYKKESFSPIITFLISAEDKNKEKYSFEFSLNLDIKDLNKMSQTNPTNIIDYVIEGEIFFQNPYKKGVEFWEIEKKENIYHFTSSYWVQKLSENKFAFKIQYQTLFIWFHVELNNCQNRKGVIPNMKTINICERDAGVQNIKRYFSEIIKIVKRKQSRYN